MVCAGNGLGKEKQAVEREFVIESSVYFDQFPGLLNRAYLVGWMMDGRPQRVTMGSSSHGQRKGTRE